MSYSYNKLKLTVYVKQRLTVYVYNAIIILIDMKNSIIGRNKNGYSQ